MNKKIIMILSGVAILLVAVFLLVAINKKNSSDEKSSKAETHNGDYWSNTIERGDIKEEIISGALNNQSVSIKSITIKKWGEEYNWSFSTLEPESTCGLVFDDSAVNFSSKVLQTGTFEKKLGEEIDASDYHAYYHYEMENGSAMSVNVGWGAKIVVREIDRENNKIRGWAQFDFADEKTMLEGSFEANLCE